jgi:hypothetical protein
MSIVRLWLGIDQNALTDPRKNQRRARRSKSTSMAQIEGQNAQPRISATVVTKLVEDSENKATHSNLDGGFVKSANNEDSTSIRIDIS